MVENEPNDEKVAVEKGADAPPELSSKVDEEIPAEVGIAALKDRLEKEKNARLEAEKRVFEFQNRVSSAENEIQENQLQIIKGGIERAKQELESLGRMKVDALRSGEYSDSVNLDKEIARKTAQLVQMENGRYAIEEKIKNKPAVQPQIVDPVERAASQLSPRSAAWIRRNPDYVTDPKLSKRLFGAHNYALAEGYIPDTDAYFHFVESELNSRLGGSRNEENPGDISSYSDNNGSGRKSVPVQAPSSRAASSNSGGKNSFRLTEAMKDAARVSGLSEAEYAQNLLNLKKEGKMR